jgi:hypothetical protein
MKRTLMPGVNLLRDDPPPPPTLALKLENKLRSESARGVQDEIQKDYVSKYNASDTKEIHNFPSVVFRPRSVCIICSLIMITIPLLALTYIYHGHLDCAIFKLNSALPANSRPMPDARSVSSNKEG